MKISIYVFIGVLAAIIIAYLLSELLAYIRRANRAIKNNKLTPYKTYNYGTYRPEYPPYWNRQLDEIDRVNGRLNSLEDKIDVLIEDFEEIMIDKERPSDE